MLAKASNGVSIKLQFVRAYTSRYWKLRGFSEFETHVRLSNKDTYIGSSPSHGFVLLSLTQPESEIDRAAVIREAESQPRPRRKLKDILHEEVTGWAKFAKWKWTQWQKKRSAR